MHRYERWFYLRKDGGSRNEEKWMIIHFGSRADRFIV